MQDIWREAYEAMFQRNLELLKNQEIRTEEMNAQFDSHGPFEVVELGDLELPSGQVVLGDPICYLGTNYSCPLAGRLPPGIYPVTASVWDHAVLGMRYLTVRLLITDRRPVRYQLAEKDGSGFMGLGVDAGLGALCDRETETRYRSFLKTWRSGHPGQNLYRDFFAARFAESYVHNPALQNQGGSLLNWPLPGTSCNVVMFQSGFGDGFYSAYWGLDQYSLPCSLMIRLIDPGALTLPLPKTPKPKRFYPLPGGFQRLYRGSKTGIATDKIMVKGHKVDYMYREEPAYEGDSGWRFFGGGETQKYVDDPGNSGIYALNVVANYDRSILPLLSSPAGSAFYRGRDGRLHLDEALAEEAPS